VGRPSDLGHRTKHVKGGGCRLCRCTGKKKKKKQKTSNGDKQGRMISGEGGGSGKRGGTGPSCGKEYTYSGKGGQGVMLGEAKCSRIGVEAKTSGDDDHWETDWTLKYVESERTR